MLGGANLARRGAAKPLALATADGNRDYVVGVDVISDGRGIGQFVALLSRGDVADIAWKSYPVGEESEWLAGFGTERGRACPRAVNTSLGTTLALICHDAQAYNHRNRALVERASSTTHRSLVIDEMTSRLHAARPAWVLNVVHRIAKAGSLKTFATSYKQLSNDHDWHPRVVGAFGYDHGVEDMVDTLSLNVAVSSRQCGLRRRAEGTGTITRRSVTKRPTFSSLPYNESRYAHRPHNVVTCIDPLKTSQREMRLAMGVDGTILTEGFWECLNNFESVIASIRHDLER